MGYERNDRFRDRYRDNDPYGFGQGREQGGYRGDNRYGGFSDRDARWRAQERYGRDHGRPGQQDPGYGRPADYDYDERGFFSRAGDEVR